MGARMCIRFLFRYLPGNIFRNPRNSAAFPDSVGNTSKLNHSRRSIWSGIPDSGIPAWIPEGRIRNTYVLVGILVKYGILCHVEQTYTKKTQKNRCQQWHSAVSCCCYRTPLQAATCAAATAATSWSEAVACPKRLDCFGSSTRFRKRKIVGKWCEW